jgi:hypothetical protein
MGLAITGNFQFAESLGAARALLEIAPKARISLKKLSPQLRVKLLEVKAGCQRILESCHNLLDNEELAEGENEYTEEKLQQAFAILTVHAERMQHLFDAAEPIMEGTLRRYVKDFPMRVWLDIKRIESQIDEVREIIGESLSEQFTRELAEAKSAAELASNN